MMQTMRLFCEVVRRHSFSEAAAAQGISQSAASQRISQLEKHLGVTLLDRSVRPLTLTEVGRIYLSGVENLLQRYDQLEASIRRGDDPDQPRREPKLTGTVAISAIYSSGIDLLRRVREGFMSAYPAAGVQIAYEKPDAVYQAVVRGRADVGILSYPERFRKISVLPLRQEIMVVVCPPGHALLASGQAAVHAAELHGHEMVGFDHDLPVGRRVAAYLKAHGAHPPTTHSFDNIDTLKSAVAATDRFAILPRRTVRQEVEAGTLAMLELTPPLTRPLGIIHRRTPLPGEEAVLSPVARKFVDYLLEHAGQRQEPPGIPGSAPGTPGTPGSAPGSAGSPRIKSVGFTNQRVA